MAHKLEFDRIATSVPEIPKKEPLKLDTFEREQPSLWRKLADKIGWFIIPQGNPGELEAGQRYVEAQKTMEPIPTTHRSLETDQMLGELSVHNRAEALALAQKSSPENSANLYSLLLEHEVVPDPTLHTLARNLLVEYIAKHPEAISGSVLKLNPNFYALYQKLSNEDIGTEHPQSLKTALPFLSSSVSTENIVKALSKAVDDYRTEILLPTLPKGFNISSIWLRGGMELSAITRENLNTATYVLAYIATSQSAESIKAYSSFMQKANEFAKNLQQKAVLTNQEKSFMDVYRVLEYRESLPAKERIFLGSKISKEEILAKLNAIKQAYYNSKFPFTQGKIEVQKTEHDVAKIRLDPSKSFAEQIKNWKLSTIINLARHEGLPESFLNKFEDHGLTLIQKFVYPELVKTHTNAASAEELLNLLSTDASDAEKAALLLNTIEFMREELAGKPIRKDQITEILSKLTRLGEKPAYVIQAAGKGKSTMARFAAKVLLKNVPYILFVSPVKESRSGLHTLTNLTDLQNSKTVQGKPLEFYIHPKDYDNLLKNAPIEQVASLKNGLQILDEFDSGDYGTVHEILSQAGITRIANMSATDNELRLRNTLARKLAKDHQHSKAAPLEASIKEIRENIQAEFNRQIDIDYNDYDPTQTKASAGKSVLVLSPNESDANALADKYNIPNAATLYRNNTGEVIARFQGKEISLKEFNTNFDKLEVKPVVYCLYTKDSRGGDFGRFSQQDRVVEQHIILKEFKSLNELYQYMRRLRRDEGADLSKITLVLHVSQGTTQETLLEKASQLGAEAAQRLEKTRLDNKVRRNMQQFMTQAITAKWQDVQNRLPGDSSPQFKAYCNEETYKQAMTAVMDNARFENTEDPIGHYQALQQAVNAKFLELVNKQYTWANTQELRDQAAILETMSRKDIITSIWKAHGSEGKTFLQIWRNYISSVLKKELTSEEARKMGVNLGVINPTFNDKTAAKNLAQGVTPSLFNNFMIITGIGKKLKDLQAKIAAADKDEKAIQGLRDIASSDISLDQLPSGLENAKELNDVKFYQGQLNALE